MHRDHDDEIAVLVVCVHDEQPPPGAEDEAEWTPGGAQLGPHARKSLERSQGAPNSHAGIGREAMSDDEPIEVFDRGWADRYAGQALQPIELDRLAGPSLCKSGLGALVGARNAVEQGGDIPRLRVRFFDCRREQRPRERALLHVRALGKSREPSRMLRVEGDVQAVRRTCHSAQS